MDYAEYRRQFFVDPPREPRFEIRGIGGVSIFVADFATALAYYTEVLGSPDYVEGDDTRGWRLGNAWLTLFPSADGGPHNADIQLVQPIDGCGLKTIPVAEALGDEVNDIAAQQLDHPVDAVGITGTHVHDLS